MFLFQLRVAIENVNSGTLTPETVKQKQEEEAAKAQAQKGRLQRKVSFSMDYNKNQTYE